MILKSGNLDIQIFNTFDAVEEFRNMILISISINDFNLKSFDDNLYDFDLKSKNEIN